MRTPYLLFGSLMAGSLNALGAVSAIAESVLLAANFVSLALDIRDDLNQWRRERALPR